MPSMPRKRDANALRVAVVGGSMGGLTTAFLLRTRGHDIDVFERATGELTGFGAGIVAHEVSLRYFVERTTASLLTYDRRGHSQSERPTAQGSVREHVADRAALMEHLGLAPAWMVGNSFGASITLRLAGERPELFRGLIAHEPPLLSLLAENPARKYPS